MAATARSGITNAMFRLYGLAATAPTAKRRESPGRMGVMTRPVSQKIITKRIR
jgi:hypothetical protein